ncbi:unnamed protein product [Closterium sp. NIES-54]
MEWLQERQGRVAYLVEILDLEGDSREPIRVVKERIKEQLGEGVSSNAAIMGPLAHRLRMYWQNIVPAPNLQEEINGVLRAPGRKVQYILEPGRTPAPVCRKGYSRHYPCNQVGQDRRALPTLVTYAGAAGYAWAAWEPGPGLIYEHKKQRWEEPTALEWELAMGYGENATAAPGVSEADRRRALGNAVDGNMMRWLIQRIWRETVVSWGQEEEKGGMEPRPQGAWTCQEEGETWKVGEAMSEEGKEAMQRLLTKHRKCFAFNLQELGRCKVKEMELKLSSAEPVLHRRRKMPHGDEEICKEKIKELLEAGLIRRSESEYATPTVVAVRKDLTGEVLSRRMCGDYRALNKITVADRYPMPMAEEIFHKLADGVFFTTLDLWQGFNQIKIREEDIKKMVGQYKAAESSSGRGRVTSDYNVVQGFSSLVLAKVGAFG